MAIFNNSILRFRGLASPSTAALT